MKTSNIRVLALFSLIAVLGPAAVKAESSASFVIPFGFTVGTESFSAGSYRVGELSPHVLHIQGDGRNSNKVFIGIGSLPTRSTSNQVTLTFRRYGERYFLAKWAGTGAGIELRKSAGEKELIARQAAASAPALIASSGK
jgi:hypothetical protein